MNSETFYWCMVVISVVALSSALIIFNEEFFKEDDVADYEIECTISDGSESIPVNCEDLINVLGGKGKYHEI